ncbi:MAG: ATP-binding cassette domain-containing protein [Lachnospiraceae bacterium]|nr:ATP-binding cassette domain-containing protein [Lachnospiraceae bacterium]
MEIYGFQNVTFQYPESHHKVLSNISFSIQKGEFVLLCGPSGCGKSTLLRHFKTCLTPYGGFSGEISYKETPMDEIDQRTQAREIGYVLQSPENQVVTDKVWHELAFGLESLGYDTPKIRRRVAEIAAFFGIEGWFYKNVNELSGGQKQILSLASIMAMQPEVLILDEPTAQLDPIAASDFLALIGKINRELGTTIILTEHRLEEVFPFATRVIVMEKGQIVCDDRPEQVGMLLREKGSGMFLAMPSAMRVWAALETELPCPMTIRDGKEFLTNREQECHFLELKGFVADPLETDHVLECEEIWFRYEKELPDVVKGFSLKLQKGEFYALLGGNGAGKSTTVKVLSGLYHPYRGNVHVKGTVALLPQNPQALFVKRTVKEDLYEVFRGQKIVKEEQDRLLEWVVAVCELEAFLERHPYDLSGGEQQRSALAKVLLMSPDLLLLDEPTKGFDAEFKVAFAHILEKLLDQGVTILMVSHDVNFCAEYAHRCGLFFDGSVVAEGTPREFFSGNSFYTTSANRMARHVLPKAVTVAEVIRCCGGRRETVNYEKHKNEIKPIHRTEETYAQTEIFPLWRKLLIMLTGTLALLIFLYATSITDLSAFINAHGLAEAAESQIRLYGILIVDLLMLVFAIGRRSAPRILEQTPKQKRKLNKRTKTASILILLFIPLTIFTGVFYLGDRYYHMIAMIVLFECMLPFLLVFEGRKPKARELVTISVLCAICVASHSAFFMLPQFKPVMAMTIIVGVAFGGETGFLVGAVTMLVSNILFSQGPWTPWQMFSMGIIGFLAGVLFRKGWLRRNRSSLAIFGAFSAVVIYGGIMNFAMAVMRGAEGLNRTVILAYYISGIPMDLIHGFATVIFLMFAAEPMLEKLDRIKEKYGLME